MMIPNPKEAIQVAFLKPIFEDDFVEAGMQAWFIAADWHKEVECFKLYFNFEDFERVNDKYFRETFHPNIHTAKSCPNATKKFFTAMEAGWYNPRYSVYLGVPGVTAENYDEVSAPALAGQASRADALFGREVLKYLRIVK